MLTLLYVYVVEVYVVEFRYVKLKLCYFLDFFLELYRTDHYLLGYIHNSSFRYPLFLASQPDFISCSG